MQHVIDISQEQAEAILQIRIVEPEFAPGWIVVCKGYDEDWDNYTELDVDDLESVVEGSYGDYQLWYQA